MNLSAILETAHFYVRQAIQEAKKKNEPLYVLDGTVGNGYDTLFLAKEVGETGHVFGFDLQAQAIETTRARLEEAQLLQRTTLFHTGHERLNEVLPPETKGKLCAAMYNLGYLPHSDQSVITQAKTTLPALDQTLAWLKTNGILSVVLYTGHPGGQEEADAVISWSRQLSGKQFSAVWMQVMNRNHSPSLLLVEKRK